MKTKERIPGTGCYIIFCPGCNHEHYINTIKPLENGAIWSFNGDFVNPTFSPSVNIFYLEKVDPEIPDYKCHFVITGGMITFCSDTTHQLSGKQVELPDKF